MKKCLFCNKTTGVFASLLFENKKLICMGHYNRIFRNRLNSDQIVEELIQEKKEEEKTFIRDQMGKVYQHQIELKEQHKHQMQQSKKKMILRPRTKVNFILSPSKKSRKEKKTHTLQSQMNIVDDQQELPPPERDDHEDNDKEKDDQQELPPPERDDHEDNDKEKDDQQELPPPERDDYEDNDNFNDYNFNDFENNNQASPMNEPMREIRNESDLQIVLPPIPEISTNHLQNYFGSKTLEIRLFEKEKEPIKEEITPFDCYQEISDKFVKFAEQEIEKEKEKEIEQELQEGSVSENENENEKELGNISESGILSENQNEKEKEYTNNNLNYNLRRRPQSQSQSQSHHKQLPEEIGDYFNFVNLKTCLSNFLRKMKKNL
eukprot:TRINITY_DN2647_c0_g2_i2.p1 TRINITY_DN2647_c0_g2~~TRINITY_DN2647_c0_g2_i2.p1  ORF type:complete len:378 (-),score=152.97 TRINITY_DN2647_c0_g2_i2:63-1196(-)